MKAEPTTYTEFSTCFLCGRYLTVDEVKLHTQQKLCDICVEKLEAMGLIRQEPK